MDRRIGPRSDPTISKFQLERLYKNHYEFATDQFDRSKVTSTWVLLFHQVKGMPTYRYIQDRFIQNILGFSKTSRITFMMQIYLANQIIHLGPQ